MPPRELDLHFALRYAQPVTLVLEAVDSDAVWRAIYDLADALVQSLPGRLSRLYFLGNRTSYPITLARDFRDQIPAWYSANRGRVSCLGPLLEDLTEDRNAGRIVVIASQRPVDLEDWPDTEMFSRLVLVQAGAAFASGEEDWVNSRRGVEQVLAAIDDPPRLLQIKGQDFAPLVYDLREGGQAVVRYEQGEFRLEITPRGERLDLHFKALAAEPPVLQIVRASGGMEQVNGQIETAWCEALSWRPLPAVLQPVVSAGMTRTPFRCPQCGESHAYDCLLCPQGDVILRGLPLNTCLLFSSGRYLVLAGWYAWPLREAQNLLTCQGELYGGQGGGWDFLHRIEAYEQVDNGIWALFHQP